MKILNISITNYRSCISTSLAPNKYLSALIGPNGSGKTTVLSAIKLLPMLSSIRPRHSASLEPATSTCIIKAEYEIDGKKIIHTATLSLVTNEKNQDEIIQAHETWYLYDFTSSKKKINIPSWIVLDIAKDLSVSGSQSGRRDFGLGRYLSSRGITVKTLDILEKVVRSISQISYYSASQFTNPGSCPISFEVESENTRRTGISITGHKKLLYDMYMERRKDSDSYHEFLSLVGPDGIGLIEEIDFSEIETSSSNYSVQTGGQFRKIEKKNLLVIPSFKISGNKLSPNQLSEGTFKTLSLIFYLVTDKSQILMIEEPEVCVHHGLLNSIIELIKTYSKEKQIIISTHSDSVLDRLEIANIFKVRRDILSGTIVSSIHKSMKAKELAALKNYLESEGSLGEYWKHGDLESE